MKDQSSGITFEVEVQRGESLHLPDSVVANVGPGRWLVTIQPLPPIRDHSAFLSSFAPEDEGLYDA